MSRGRRREPTEASRRRDQDGRLLWLPGIRRGANADPPYGAPKRERPRAQTPMNREKNALRRRAAPFGLHQITIRGTVVTSARFSHWRRPTTPQNYFLYPTTFLALLSILAFRASGSESRDSVVGRLVDSGMTSGLMLLIEILAIPVVFSLYSVYRRILRAHDQRALIEYFLYTVGLWHTAFVAVWCLLLLTPGGQLGLFTAVGGTLLLICLHIYYWIVVPWTLFPCLLTVSKRRVAFSMPLMLFFPSFWIPISLFLLLGWLIAGLLSILADFVSRICG